MQIEIAIKLGVSAHYSIAEIKNLRLDTFG